MIQETHEDPAAVVAEQAEDDCLWLTARTITEEYLQRALRRLHRAVEGNSQGQLPPGLDGLP